MEVTKSMRQTIEKFGRHVKPRPGLSLDEIAQFERQLPGPVPDAIRDLLEYSSGFDLPSGEAIRFTGSADFAFPKALPYSIPLLGDGFGNFWVVDINAVNGVWETVFFACHDPPVFVIQAPGIGSFLEQVLSPDTTTPPRALRFIHEEATTRIWRSDPWVTPVPLARQLSDPVISTFARELPETFGISDLRHAEIGAGFRWGKAGPNAEIKRAGTALLFGIEQKLPGRLMRVLRSLRS